MNTLFQGLVLVLLPLFLSLCSAPLLSQLLIYDDADRLPIVGAYYQYDTLSQGASDTTGLIPNLRSSGTLKLSHVIYGDTTINFSTADPLPDTVWLSTNVYGLSTVGVVASKRREKRYTPLGMVKQAIRAKKKNYSEETRQERALYRERYYYGDTLLTANEAYILLRTSTYVDRASHKRAFRKGWDHTSNYIGAFSPSGSYNRMLSLPEGISKLPAPDDAYQIVEARFCSDDQQTSYPVFAAGPMGLVGLDKVRLAYDYLNSSLLKHYDFSLTDTVYVNGAYCYEVSFKPADDTPTKYFGTNRTHKTGVFEGKLYISVNEFAIVRTEARNAKSIVVNTGMAKYRYPLRKHDAITTVDYRLGADEKWRLATVRNQLAAGRDDRFTSTRTLYIYPASDSPDTTGGRWIHYDFSSVLRSYITPYADEFWVDFTESPLYTDSEVPKEAILPSEDCYRAAFDATPMKPPRYEPTDKQRRIAGRRFEDKYRALEMLSPVVRSKITEENQYYQHYLLRYNTQLRDAATEFTDERQGYHYSDNRTRVVGADTLLKTLNGVTGLYRIQTEEYPELLLALSLPSGFVFTSYGRTSSGNLRYFLLEDRHYGRLIRVYDGARMVAEMKSVGDYEWSGDTLLATTYNGVFRNDRVKRWTIDGGWSTDFQERNKESEFRLAHHASGRFYLYNESMTTTEVHEWTDGQWVLRAAEADNQRGGGHARICPDGVPADWLKDCLRVGEYELVIGSVRGREKVFCSGPGSDEWNVLSFPTEVLNHEFVRVLPGRRVVFATEGVSSYGQQYIFTPQTLTIEKSPSVGIEVSLTGYSDSLIWSAASDSIKIPTQIRWKNSERGKLKGTVLIAYGAYGNPYLAGHSAYDMALMNAGYAVGYVHTRGGGALGGKWYNDGRQANKLTACQDYLAVVDRFNLRHPLGEATGLIGQAQSAGGPILGYAVNQRPDLFRGVIFEYAFLDVVTVMADFKYPLSRYEVPEWGNPHDKEILDVQLAYSPYQIIRPQYYPPHLFQAGTNDISTPYWQVMKYVAKLRSQMTNDAPVILRVADGGTHVGTSFGPSQSQRIEQLGFIMSISQ